ncbi:MAG TPA: dethiobiotin synthase [Verrucomicrobiae bacterium]|jgi:dethiobiotin synthetase|nr:dethiobiotin synthase [Verrucomicrobiae bacterium]
MKSGRAQIVFVTGTGTGVGKTVLTTLLLAHLRGAGRRALALKPFCSGSRADAAVLWALEKECLTLDEVNPFYFSAALAPRAAVKNTDRLPSLRATVKHIETMARRCEILLIEGSGGLLVPLGAHYTVADLIQALKCPVLVASRNELGTINHTLLTVKHLQTVGVENITVALMGQERPDLSSETNLEMLDNMAPRIRFLTVSFLSRNPLRRNALKKHVTFLKKTLAQICDQAIVSPSQRKRRGNE